MNDTDDLIAAYLESCVAVRAAFAGMTREQAMAHPVAGKWSSLEVLCHLVDADLLVATRIRAALVSDHPRLPALSQQALTTPLQPESRDLAEELLLFETVRRQTARIVGGMGPEVFARAIVLTKAGGEEVTRDVGEMIRSITGHVTRHLEHVHEKRRALGLGELANSATPR